jgi:hypothetical protein
MLINDNSIVNAPLGSIRSSAKIGYVKSMVINPNNLHVDAFKCTLMNNNEQLLSPMDVRDMSPMGIIINDHDHLLDYEDAVRLKPILDINFNLLTKVAYVGKRRVGKVDGFAVNSSNFYIQKIYVKPGLIARVGADRLTFDRSTIEELTNTKIVFKNSNEVRHRDFIEEKVLNKIQAAQPSASASFTSENE